ncbi:MAG: flagellar M-ring protein FliF [Syntrophomonadaceae bacterium]|nr:flagellar M-ring protein FliF [Syntrophomonadaceae bacterium]
MSELWNSFKEKGLGYWNSWTLNQKVLIGGGILLLIIGLVMAIWMLKQPDDMVPLYTQLESNDAAAITAKLKEMKIPYELTDGGSTILVAPASKYQTRLDLAAEGLPRGAAGFESLGETKFGETTRDKQVRFTLALQGELARTISHLKGIEQAWVYLTMPEETLFIKDRQARTASVMIKLSPGYELEPEQVKGIVHMVAKAVEGLKPEEVTVVDINGRILSEDLVSVNPQFSTNRLTAHQLEIQKQFEKDLAQTVQSMLERVVGLGNATVRVRAELDFDQKEVVTENWGGKVPRSTENTEEVTQGLNAAAQGAAGTPANIPEFPAVDGQNLNFYQEKTTSVVNNEIDRTETHQVVSPGAIKRLTVAVMVNGEQLPPERLTAIEQAARMAAGINEGRGDMITVSAMPFDTSYWDRLQAQIDAEARRAEMQKWVLIGGVLLALFLVGLILWLMNRRRYKEQIIDEMVDEPVLVEELLDMEEPLTPEEQEKVKIREQIEALIRERPEDAARLIQVWLAED